MPSSSIPFKLRLQVSRRGLIAVLRRPRYVLVAAAVAAVVLGVLLWAFNLNLLAFVFGNARLSLWDKLRFFVGGYGSIFTNLDSFPAVSTFLISVLIGINTALIVFVGKAAQKGKGTAAFFTGLIGAGCAVCGTGILGPLLGAAGAAGAVTLASFIGVIALLLAILLLVYSVYGLGIQAANLAAKEQL